MRIKRILKNFKDQSGRTLVELLGVLVIIGVLSMAALYGFDYAMEASRENETLNRYAKVVAGARTSRILQNLGDYTKYDTQTGAALPEFKPQKVDMHDVISNIGDDIYATDDESYILAPLKGPIKDGTEKQVEIYVYVETPSAFTVYADYLTKGACKKIVKANLGYSFTFEATEDTEKWRVPALVQTNDGADLFCEQIATGQETVLASYFNPFIKQATAQTNEHKGGTLVMWFGPYECVGKDCVPPSCQGAECCCETRGTTVTLKDPAPIGCAPAKGGKCADCAEPDSNGICQPKIGVGTCGETCFVSLCQRKEKPYYCGEGLCCASAESCGDGTCKDIPPTCKDPRPTVCGQQCCAENEECIEDRLGVKYCEMRPTPGSCTLLQTPCYDQNGFFTGCCTAYQVCNVWGECVSGGGGGSCLPPKFKCGTDCCAKNQICDKGNCKDIDKECEEECKNLGGSGKRMDNGTGNCCCTGNGGRIVTKP